MPGNRRRADVIDAHRAREQFPQVRCKLCALTSPRLAVGHHLDPTTERLIWKRHRRRLTAASMHQRPDLPVAAIGGARVRRRCPPVSTRA